MKAESTTNQTDNPQHTSSLQIDDENIHENVTLSHSQESLIEKIFSLLAFLAILLCPIVLVSCFRVVKQYKRAVILRFGRIRKDSPAGPGIIWVIPCTDSVIIYDLRTQSLKLPPQEILTKDSVTVTVGAVVYYHVLRPVECFMNINSHYFATEVMATASLRNLIGQHTLADLLTSRGLLSKWARKDTERITSYWGVSIERIEIKDIFLPLELQKAMAAEAEGTRVAKSKIIQAEGEIKAAENLREASRIIMQHPPTILLRYLEALDFIAADERATILFPFPIDMPDPHTLLQQ